MKIRFANDTTTKDGDFKAGSVHDLPNVDARNLIHLGKAVELSPGQKAAATRAARAGKGTKTATADQTSAAAETTTPAAGE